MHIWDTDLCPENIGHKFVSRLLHSMMKFIVCCCTDLSKKRGHDAAAGPASKRVKPASGGSVKLHLKKELKEPGK